MAAEGKVFASSIQQVSKMGMVDIVFKCMKYPWKRILVSCWEIAC